MKRLSIALFVWAAVVLVALFSYWALLVCTDVRLLPPDAPCVRSGKCGSDGRSMGLSVLLVLMAVVSLAGGMAARFAAEGETS